LPATLAGLAFPLTAAGRFAGGLSY